jgi:hypothetical protein
MRNAQTFASQQPSVLRRPSFKIGNPVHNLAIHDAASRSATPPANHLPSCVERHIMNFRETPRQARGPTVCLRHPLNILEKREHQSVR